MHDPTRIDPVLAAVRRAWEGQPDLSLPTLFGILAGQGVGWGATDEELVTALDKMTRMHPPALPLDANGQVEGAYVVTLDAGAVRVTLNNELVVVRRHEAGAGPRQPVVWRYAGIRPVGPGRPLVVRDEAGAEHRLGVAELLTRVRNTQGTAAAAELEGRTRARMGETAYVVRCVDEVVLVEHGLWTFRAQARAVERTSHDWRKIVRCRVGEPLLVALTGGREVELGVVESVVLAEAPV